jgi:prepilin-type processing-associated H-X9-DG protein
MAARHPFRSAFTIVHLLAVIGIIAFLIAMMLPALCRSTEQGNRVKCASNLRQIGLAIQMYANDNKGAFPRTLFDGTDDPKPAVFTGAAAADPFAPSGPSANDVSASLFLVLRTQDLTSEVFVCPSSSAERKSGDLRQASNWKSVEEVSYSSINPYPGKACRDAAKEDSLNVNHLNSDFAIGSDLNPGGPAVTTVRPDSKRRDVQAANTRNHNGDGQNVLYGDGHVEFQTTPFAGMPRQQSGLAVRDNIFASNTSPPAVFAAMADTLDSVLLPTDDPKTAPSSLAVSMNTRALGARHVVWLAAGAVALVALGCGGLAVRAARRRRPSAM